MKKKIIKLWGVGMIVMLVASLFLVGATPAAAGTLSWSSINVPNTPPTSNQIAAGTDVAKVTVAPNGDIFVIDSATPTNIYKSTDGGYTWKMATVGGVTTLVDLVVSPSYETDGRVFAVGNAGANVQAYYSTNSGASFSAFSVPIVAGTANSIAIAPNYVAGNGELMVATSVNVYVWKDNTMSWGTIGALVAFDAEYSPNYPIDGTRVAVSATDVHTNVGSDGAWDATLPNNPGIAGAAGAEIEFPSDFMASNPSARTLFVSVPGADVFRATVGSATAAAALGLGTSPQSIVQSGTLADGILYAGAAGTTQVFRSENADVNPPTAVTWKAAAAPPTGTGMTYVAVADSMVYAGTAGPNSAFSVSADGGSHFYQTGLIDTAITVINDMQFTSADEAYLLTNNGGTSDSLWKTANGGSTWDRIYNITDADGVSSLAISMDYGADDTLVLADTGIMGANAFFVSNDSGSTWVPRAVPGINCGPVVVKDQYTFYVGANNTNGVQMTANGGWTWQPGPTTAGTGTITDLLIDAGTGDILAGDSNGGVALSTDNNKTYKAQGGGLGASIVGVAFDIAYGSNGTFYAAAAGNVSRYPVNNTWGSITPNDGALVPANVDSVQDIGIAPDGTLYVTDLNDANMYRSINPTAKTVVWSIAPAGGTNNLGTFNLLPGSVVIIAVDPVANKILTYKDILTTAVPTIVSPAEGDVVLASAAAVSIERISGNENGTYVVQWNTRPDWLGTGNIHVIPTIDSVALTTVGGFAPPAGATIYIRVQAIAPLLGPWSDTVSFETQLAPAGINAPAILSPVVGGTGPGGYDADINPTFNWGNIGGATAYEFQLGTSATMAPSTLLVDATGSLNRLGNVLVYKLTDITLDYGTTYYWRVRAVSATSETEWSAVIGFTTMEEPVEPPTPTTIQPTPTTITIDIPTQPPATTTEVVIEETKIAEGYIWAIIIIGAVLVIAVIVLIVRTRRSV